MLDNFHYACNNEDLQTVKSIIKQNNLTFASIITNKVNNLLCECTKGPDSLRFFITYCGHDKNNLLAFNNLLFRWSCCIGSLKTAQRLHNIFKMSREEIMINNNCAYALAYINNKKDVSEWLFKICNMKNNEIEIMNNTQYYKNQEKIMEWILTLSNINSYNNDVCDCTIPDHMLV